MEYTQEMNLLSKSGYCMPFEERNGQVQITLGYGKQTHPLSGEEFFHHGVDFKADRYLLAALADGTVSGIGSTPTHGLYQIVRYGKYEVTYAHLSNVLATFGMRVRAGNTVAVSDDLLHMEVKYDGEEINPLEFLAMLYGNLKTLEQTGRTGNVEFETIDMSVPTDYDDDQEEIEELMLRFYPDYMSAIYNGIYRLPEHTEHSLRNIFSMAAVKNYFYETLPSLANPLGIGQKAVPIACKVQNLLIGDFLNYLALKHSIYLSTWDEHEKKKAQEQAIAESGIIDPLSELEIDIQSFDIPRLVTVYPDRGGLRWWTKAWFNNKEEGEASVEISRQVAIRFIQDEIEKDAMLEEYFPKQMEVYHHAIEQTREQLMNQMNM